MHNTQVALWANVEFQGTLVCKKWKQMFELFKVWFWSKSIWFGSWSNTIMEACMMIISGPLHSLWASFWASTHYSCGIRQTKPLAHKAPVKSVLILGGRELAHGRFYPSIIRQELKRLIRTCYNSHAKGFQMLLTVLPFLNSNGVSNFYIFMVSNN